MEKRRYLFNVFIFLIITLCFSTLGANAQESVNLINYQGSLIDANGPLDGTQTMTFEIFDTESPGVSDIPLWSETISNVEVAEGIFNVYLGAASAFPSGLFNQNDDLYLRITVGGETLLPLQHFSSVPYAMRADHADVATLADALLNDTVTGDFQVNGELGVGTSNPTAKLHIVMPEGSDLLPSLTPGLVIEDVAGNAGYRFQIRDENGESEFVVDGSGKVGIGTPIPDTALSVRGNVTILSESSGNPILELGEGLDYAEGFDVTESLAEPGTVLAIDENNPGHLTICSTAYDRKVAGIVAGANRLGSGVRLGDSKFDQDVALAGRVYCKVETMKEGIVPGDLLTTSKITGHAMKVIDYTQAQGAVLGKAMEPLEKGKQGMILVLVTLQ